MNPIQNPERGLVDYYVKKEFPDKYCCYIVPWDLDNNLDAWGEFCKELNIDWIDFIGEEMIFLEFDTEDEMLEYVNNYPTNGPLGGYCLGYSKGRVSTENT